MVAVQPQSICVRERDFVQVGEGVTLTRIDGCSWRSGDTGDVLTREDVIKVIRDIHRAIIEAGIGSDQVAVVKVHPLKAALLLAFDIIDASAYMRSRITNEGVIFGNAIITCRIVEVHAMSCPDFETITASVRPAD